MNFDIRSQAAVALFPDTWKFRPAEEQEQLIEQFTAWVGRSETWNSQAWKRELIVQLVAIQDHRLVDVVVDAIKSGRVKLQSLDATMLELIKLIRKDSRGYEHVLRVIDVLAGSPTCREFLVRSCPGLVNFLCSCLSEAGLAELAADCIRKCAFEFEFRAKLSLNAQVHQYLATDKFKYCAHARRQLLIALEH